MDAGTVHLATLRVNPHRRREGYATIAGMAQDALIDGLKDQNRAFEGDVVYLELCGSKSKTDTSAAQRADDLSSTSASDDDIDDQIDELATDLSAQLNVEASESAAAPSGTKAEQPAKRPRGRVVGIAEALHRTRQFIGTLRATKPGADLAEFVPTDKRAPLFLVPLREHLQEMTADPKLFEEKLFVVEFLRWPADLFWPRGRIVRSLGRSGNLEAESMALLAEYSIDDRPHTEAMTSKLPDKMVVMPYDQKVRLDLRHCVRIFSIDPATTRDVDDALSIEAAGEGLWTVGVHIADVSHYVSPGTPLDREAEKCAHSSLL